MKFIFHKKKVSDEDIEKYIGEDKKIIYKSKKQKINAIF